MSIKLSDVVGQDKINEFSDFFWYLYHRWTDEGQFEDFNEYKEVAEKRFGFPIVRMTSDPFQVIFDINGTQGIFMIDAKDIPEILRYGTVRSF